MNAGIVILVAVALAAVVLIVATYLRRRTPDDHVDSFRRQIDALVTAGAPAHDQQDEPTRTITGGR